MAKKLCNEIFSDLIDLVRSVIYTVLMICLISCPIAFLLDSKEAQFLIIIAFVLLLMLARYRKNKQMGYATIAFLFLSIAFVS